MGEVRTGTEDSIVMCGRSDFLEDGKLVLKTHNLKVIVEKGVSGGEIIESLDAIADVIAGTVGHAVLYAEGRIERGG